MIKYELRLSILVLLVGLSSTAWAQDNDESTWSITPYIWASDTELDLSVQDPNIFAGTKISFDELLDTLDAAFQIHVEGGKGNWSGFGDLVYVSTSDDNTRPLLATEVRNKQLFIDIDAAYWPAGVGTNLNFYGGLRYSGFDDRYRFTLGKRQQNRIVFGYQYKEAEYEDGGLTTEFTLSGPMAGFNFRF